MLIDDFADAALVSTLGTSWRGVSDRVMGGISEARISHDRSGDRACLRLTGDVRLENNGGFVQASLDLAPGGGVLDASRHTGLRLSVRGNGECYGVHLRTADTRRPWQSYRVGFTAGETWASIDLPFEQFRAHRLDAALDVRALRRIGLAAIGRAFTADLWVSDLRFYP